jgi:hypothetical protein
MKPITKAPDEVLRRDTQARVEAAALNAGTEQVIDGRIVIDAPQGYGPPELEADDWHFPDAAALAEMEATQ